MHVLTLTKLKSPLELQERPALTPQPGEVVVRLQAAAVNRRDYWITQGMYPGIELPVVLGSDGAGVVEEVGDDVEDSWRGREVIINPGFNWGDQPSAHSGDFAILGMPRDGTFATEVVVPAAQLHEKPPHMDWHQAAALPLAGVTAWRALFTQGRLQQNETVLITGIGGGVATFALQFALAAGATVWVTSSSAEKIARAVELGAAGGFDYTEPDWPEAFVQQAGPPHLIIDSAGGRGYAALLEVAAPGGRVVNYGATTGPPEKLDLFKLFWKQLRLIGTTMGSPDDFRAMLRFATDHKLVPLIESVLPLPDGNKALEQMKNSPQFGKYVLAIDD